MLRSSVVLKNAMTIFVRPATTEEAVNLNRIDEGTVRPIQPADNPCGILKVEVIAGQRRFGGVITGMLACGVVDNVHLTAGAVPASLMCGMASEIYKISAKIVQHHLRPCLYVGPIRAEAVTVWDDFTLLCFVFSLPLHGISFSHMATDVATMTFALDLNYLKKTTALFCRGTTFCTRQKCRSNGTQRGRI